MKHQKFNEIFPYTYFIKHIPTGLKYYGVRFANSIGKTTPLLAPVDDFMINYFTSISNPLFQWFKDRLKSCPSEFSTKICYTFDSIDEACLYEKNIVSKIINSSSWVNTGNGVYASWHKILPEKLESIKQKMKDNHDDFSGKNHPQYGTTHSSVRIKKVSDGLIKFHKANPGFTAGRNNAMYGSGDAYYLLSPDGVGYFIYAGIVDFCKSQGIDFKCVRNWAFGRTKSKSGWYVKILNGQGLTVLDE